MRSIPVAIAVAFGLLCTTAVEAAGVKQATPGRLTVLAKSGPHSIDAKHYLVTFDLRITGVKMHAFGPKVKNGPHQGHVRIYLDKVPADAYKKLDLSGRVNDFVPAIKTGSGTYKQTIGFDRAWIKDFKGHHVLRIGLAENNGVMYRVTIASFPLVVK